MTRARDVADTQDNLGGAVPPFVAGKNKIINGNFAIAQRGTSVAVGAAAYTYTLDRFKTYSANTATTVSQNTSAPTGFSYSCKLQRPNANTGTNSLAVAQIVETENVLALQGQIATVSFYVKKGANYSGGNITVQGLTGTVADQGGDPYSFTGLSTFVNDAGYSPTTSFVRVSYTGTVASNVKEIAVVITYTGSGTAGADDALYIAGLQLEQGSVATPFTTASGSIGGELALCQRYYERQTPGSSNFSIPGFNNSTTNGYHTWHYKVTKRTTPTIALNATTDFSVRTPAGNVQCTGFSIIGNNVDNAWMSTTVGSGLTTGNGNFLVNSGVSPYVEASAEL
jgi:hypothetical protein